MPKKTAEPVEQISDLLIVKSLSAADYNTTHEAMLTRTLERIACKKEQALSTPDELWIVDHNDVYTLGQAGKEEHILQRTNTPIIKTDRGGQVTWHGSGQLVVYWLLDLGSLGWSVRNLVSHAEQALEDVINECLNEQSLTDSQTIDAHARQDAPGVYLYSTLSNAKQLDSKQSDSVDHTDSATDKNANDCERIMIGKIASLGFKIKHGFSYHGIALNINCDLSAFDAINPCGYAGMQMLRLADFVALNEQTTTTDSEPLTYELITQRLINNIAKRHTGNIALRS